MNARVRGEEKPKIISFLFTEIKFMMMQLKERSKNMHLRTA